LWEEPFESVLTILEGGHAVGTLIKEVVRAIRVPQVVKTPGLAVGLSISHDLLID
jgi:hypothetical protein